MLPWGYSGRPWKLGYGRQAGPPPCPVLALMASVVLPAMGRRQLTTFGLAAKLTPRQVATSLGTIPMATVAATTDLETQLAAAAVPLMKNPHLTRRHRSPKAGALDNRIPPVRGSTCLVLPLP